MDEKQENREKKSSNIDLQKQQGSVDRPKELGGPKGPEPTRYGDWERRGRCIDF
ncbi:MAG: DUF1674 domain-containing protein [Gammaproteobacteria bacterium]|nr:DUF1674 domain-containing protein [Gammaproteobacteria bacterium]